MESLIFDYFLTYKNGNFIFSSNDYVQRAKELGFFLFICFLSVRRELLKVFILWSHQGVFALGKLP